MNRRLFFVFLLIIAGAVVFGMMVKPKQNLAVKDTVLQPTVFQTQPQLLSPQTRTMGAVEVAVTPLKAASEEDIIFELSLNTHSVNLNYDYTQIVTLTDNLGKVYKALEWTGGNDGHHLSGNLVFEPLVDNVQTLTLGINGVDNQSASFTWDL